MMLTDLPYEIVDMIVKKLPKKDAISFTSTNKDLRRHYERYVVRRCKFNIGDMHNKDFNYNWNIHNIVELDDVNESFIHLVTPYDFPNLRKLKLDDDFDLPIGKYNLPDKLEELIFGKLYNQPIQIKTYDNPLGIPKSVKVLDLGFVFEHKISVLPPNLQILTLSYPCNVSNLSEILSSLTSLKEFHVNPRYDFTIYSSQDDELTVRWPSSLEILNLQCMMLRTKFVTNYGLSLLPESLKELRLNWFDDPLVSDKGVPLLPQSLRKLEFGFAFNEPLVSEEGVPLLPHSLVELEFGDLFNKPIGSEDGTPYLPNSLRSLKFSQLSGSFRQKFESDEGVPLLPPLLTTLVLPGCWNDSLETKRGRRLLPYSLETVIFNWLFNHPLISTDGLPLLPPSLKKLNLGVKFDQPLVSDDGYPLLPESLTELHLSDDYSWSFLADDGYPLLPPSLKKLVFGCDFNQPIVSPDGYRILPDSITALDFRNKFNHPIVSDTGETLLPKSLVGVRFGTCFNQLLHKVPNGVQLIILNGYSKVYYNRLRMVAKELLPIVQFDI